MAIDAPTTAPSGSQPMLPPLILSGRQSTLAAGTYSAGITEIIKMLDARVDEPVILAFIQNSPTLYNPDAAELVALKEHGASPETLLAMFRHGDELRSRLAQTLSAANPTPPVAPAYDYAPETEAPAPSATPNPAPEDVLYPPTIYGFAYRWPWLCRTPVCNNYRPYWYERGCWYARRGDPHPVGEGGHQSSTSPASPARQVMHSVSGANTAPTRSVAAHSGIARVSAAGVARVSAVRSGGQLSGRSR
jgi:hypothetical protein